MKSVGGQGGLEIAVCFSENNKMSAASFKLNPVFSNGSKISLASRKKIDSIEKKICVVALVRWDMKPVFF